MNQEKPNKQREGFTFYRSFFEAIETARTELNAPPEQLLEVYTMIARYALDHEEPQNPTGFAKMLWSQIRLLLEKNWKKYEDGCKGATHGNKGGNPNFKPGQRNPYYQTDNPTDNPTTNKGKETPGDTGEFSEADYEKVMHLWNNTVLWNQPNITSLNTSRKDRRIDINTAKNALFVKIGRKDKEEVFKCLKHVFEVVESCGLTCTFEQAIKTDNVFYFLDMKPGDRLKEGTLGLYKDKRKR